MKKLLKKILEDRLLRFFIKMKIKLFEGKKNFEKMNQGILYLEMAEEKINLRKRSKVAQLEGNIGALEHNLDYCCSLHNDKEGAKRLLANLDLFVESVELMGVHVQKYRDQIEEISNKYNEALK